MLKTVTAHHCRKSDESRMAHIVLATTRGATFPTRVGTEPKEHMKHDQRKYYLTRNGLLNLLSDAEVASVSRAETAVALMDGEEYIDLAHLDRGVQCARGTTTPMGRVLPRKAVGEETWAQVLDHLISLESAAQNSRV
jgi:hypothetical protein